MDAKYQLDIEAVFAVITAIVSHPHQPRGSAPRAIESSDFLQLSWRQALSKCRDRTDRQQPRNESDDPQAAKAKNSWRNDLNLFAHTIPFCNSGSSRQEPCAGKTPLTALRREKSLSFGSVTRCGGSRPSCTLFAACSRTLRKAMIVLSL